MLNERRFENQMQVGRLEADESAEQVQGPDAILGLYKEVVKF